jgi:hypothetical protein
MKGKGRWIALALVLTIGVLTLLQMDREADGGQSEAVRRIERVVPDSVRIQVEVLNASGNRGWARRATTAMRDAGFDVVASGNWAERLDSSVVLVRSGRMDWAALAAEALGGARIQARPDSSRYLDLTILIGTTWRPPPEAFDP